MVGLTPKVEHQLTSQVDGRMNRLMTSFSMHSGHLEQLATATYSLMELVEMHQLLHRLQQHLRQLPLQLLQARLATPLVVGLMELQYLQQVRVIPSVRAHL